jgi:tryptophan 7-halogenase
MALPDTLTYRLDHYRGSGRIVLGQEELFRDASWFAVLDGQGVRATDHSPMIEAMPAEQNRAHLVAVRDAIRAACDQLPELRRTRRD